MAGEQVEVTTMFIDIRDFTGFAEETPADQVVSALTSEQGLEIGIGLNSGTLVAGNVGGAGRLEFSVIGDPVNVAARSRRRPGTPATRSCSRSAPRSC
jgi:class 3 adenylate cyclase